MIVRLGSIVKVTYHDIFSPLGSQTAVLAAAAGFWNENQDYTKIRMVFLTPPTNMPRVGFNVGDHQEWFTIFCLGYFDLEVLEEGDGTFIPLSGVVL